MGILILIGRHLYIETAAWCPGKERWCLQGLVSVNLAGQILQKKVCCCVTMWNEATFSPFHGRLVQQETGPWWLFFALVGDLCRKKIIAIVHFGWSTIVCGKWLTPWKKIVSIYEAPKRSIQGYLDMTRPSITLILILIMWNWLLSIPRAWKGWHPILDEVKKNCSKAKAMNVKPLKVDC